MNARKVIPFHTPKAKAKAKPKPQTFTNRERIMDVLSERIMKSPWSYETIARDLNLSPATVMRVARRETTWPRPSTLFPMLRYFNLELEVKESNNGP